ncbi:MAG TPA: ubiquinol-cytochrome C chaperone family protein [Candidatus Omnitrophota bacterium]|nr:ubiquinol-cytochrome C chaperone family protein [Candidatus Omnitrophota bacterium]
MPFRRFLDRRRRERVAHGLYVAVVEQSRHPAFYRDLGVPDNVDGRFDLLAAHAFLAMRRLGRIGGTQADEARILSQSLFDLMFADMDQNLREMGVTDLAVGRKVHQMAEAFYGRVSAYETAIAEGEAALAQAVERNLYRKAEGVAPDQPAKVAAYLIRQDAHLATLADDALMDGRLAFAPLD